MPILLCEDFSFPCLFISFSFQLFGIFHICVVFGYILHSAHMLNLLFVPLISPNVFIIWVLPGNCAICSAGRLSWPVLSDYCHSRVSSQWIWLRICVERMLGLLIPRRLCGKWVPEMRFLCFLFGYGRGILAVCFFLGQLMNF